MASKQMKIRTLTPPPPTFTAVPWSDQATLCACCDSETRVIYGGIFAYDLIRAVYFLSWTRDRPEYAPHIDLILGPWGPGSSASARVLISMACRAERQGGIFVQIDSTRRPANSPQYCGRALAADEALPPQFAGELPYYVDAIRKSEPFIHQISSRLPVKNACAEDELSCQRSAPHL